MLWCRGEGVVGYLAFVARVSSDPSIRHAKPPATFHSHEPHTAPVSRQSTELPSFTNYG
jgi:hypothetical protein